MINKKKIYQQIKLRKLKSQLNEDSLKILDRDILKIIDKVLGDDK